MWVSFLLCNEKHVADIVSRSAGICKNCQIDWVYRGKIAFCLFILYFRSSSKFITYFSKMKMSFFLVFLFLFFFIHFSTSISDCIRFCECDGDTMDCRDRSLLHINVFFNARIKYVDYRQNRITVDSLKKLVDGLPSK